MASTSSFTHPLEPKRLTLNHHHAPGYYVEPSKAVWYTCSSLAVSQGCGVALSSTDGLLMAVDYDHNGAAIGIVGHVIADESIAIDLSFHPEAPIDPLEECCQNCQNYGDYLTSRCQTCMLDSCDFHPNFQMKNPIKKAILTGEEILPLPNTDLIL